MIMDANRKAMIMLQTIVVQNGPIDDFTRMEKKVFSSNLFIWKIVEYIFSE